MSYHNASVVLGIQPYTEDNGGRGADDFDHSDPRWPTRCPCGYEFQDSDHWQHNLSRMHERSDNGPATTLGNAPPGAMWWADWMPESYRGPDGHTLCVRVIANRDWLPDAKDKSGKAWTRTGTPPNVTAKPSIGMYGPDGKGYAYHGFLTAGVLIEC